jgi:adenylate cyclase
MLSFINFGILFFDNTDAIVESQGEIYKYVGDEVIVSWKIQDGLQDYNCISCIINIIQSNEDSYQKLFGYIP